MAVVWNNKGTLTALPPLAGYDDSIAFAINARGQVVGQSLLNDGDSSMAVVWDRKGTPTALPPLPGDFDSTARGINARGEVVGDSWSGFDFFTPTAVVWR
jgi:uncharacterized membrane protein